MTVAELIKALSEFDPDLKVFCTGSTDEAAYDPEPEYCDWGRPDADNAGVYL